MSRKPHQIFPILLIALTVRLIYAFFVPEFALSLDMQRWLKVAELLRQGANPYVATSYLNTAPFSMQAIAVFDQLARYLSLNLTLLLQLLFISVDLLTIAVLSQALEWPKSPRSAKALVWGYALSPVSIILSVQHGQFDVFVGLFTLLFVVEFASFLKEKDETRWLLACAFLGLAIWSKTAPIILLPLALSPRGLSKFTRIFGATIALTPIALTMSVIFVLAPTDVADKVIGYASVPGLYGFTGLLGLSGGAALFKPYTQIFFLALVGFLIYLSKYLSEHPLRDMQSIGLISALLLLALPTLGPGYGNQYISWYLPLLALLYAHGSAQLSKFIQCTWIIVTCTYVFEYGLMLVGNGLQFEYIQAHMPIFSGMNLAQILTIVRLPMFLSMLALLLALWRDLPTRNNSPKSGAINL